jgi:hypothetical protein
MYVKRVGVKSKEAFVSFLKSLLQNLFEATEEKHKISEDSLSLLDK